LGEFRSDLFRRPPPIARMLTHTTLMPQHSRITRLLRLGLTYRNQNKPRRSTRGHMSPSTTCTTRTVAGRRRNGPLAPLPMAVRRSWDFAQLMCRCRHSILYIRIYSAFGYGMRLPPLFSSNPDHRFARPPRHGRTGGIAPYIFPQKR
jgi:hypothetical protein